MVSFRCCFSPLTVGAYRIRPDVGEKGNDGGEHIIVESLPRSAARFSRLGKCSCAARQGFPARENVPHEPGKVFPPGKMFPTSAARFSRLGKCSPRAQQGFPIIPTLKISIA